MNYGKKTIILIAIATLIRCIVACSVELGNDEVYYRIFASHLQWNYFDHPPMVAWLIRFTTVNLLLDNELFIRLGAILCAAFSTWLIYLSGKKLGNAQTGYFAAGIYTATLYGSIIAGTFILPDSPQMVCWMAGLYLLIDITQTNTISGSKKRQIILFGLVCGLGMLCKIHTVFLWLGFLLYIVLYKRRWFREPVLYLAGTITVLLFYPVIKWNLDNNFITFSYQGGRVNIAGSGIDLSSFFQFVGGQIFYTNPVIFIYVVVALIAAWHNRLPVSKPNKRILLLTGLPLIILATIISLFRNVLPHWTGPAYSCLILLLASYFSNKIKNLRIGKRLCPLPVLIANGLVLVILIAGIFTVNFYPGTLGKKESKQMGEGDFTLDMYGWKDFARSFERIYDSNLDSMHKSNKTIILSYKWFPAAHIDHYVAAPLGLNVYVYGEIEEIHQYKWFNEQLRGLNDSISMYLIVPSNYYHNISTSLPFLKDKKAITYKVSQIRNRIKAREFEVYYFKKDYYNLLNLKNF